MIVCYKCSFLLFLLLVVIVFFFSFGGRVWVFKFMGFWFKFNCGYLIILLEVIISFKFFVDFILLGWFCKIG